MVRHRAKRSAAFLIAIASTLAACGSDDEVQVEPAAPSTLQADDCIIYFHGKGGNGTPGELVDGVAELRPSGNANGWGGRQWLYFPDEGFAAARDVVIDTVERAGCERVVLNGFSNGAAFVSKLLCSGETLDGRLLGAVIDDPVPDLALTPCAPSPSVEAVLYWTGQLAEWAPPGTDCDRLDWTCEGDEVIDIETYAAALGVPVTPSPFSDHQPFIEAPEPAAWLAG